MMENIDLFGAAQESDLTGKPLAVRMRPCHLDEIFGQEKIIGPGTYLRAMIEKDMVPSLLLYGPSGTGKTTLAHVIAEMTKGRFVTLNAAAAGIGDVRAVIEDAKKAKRLYERRTILFLDEIHRFNKGQQDVLLPYVEDSTIILVGATTENPFFEVNRPLLSRLRIIQMAPLSETAVVQILRRALTDTEKGLGYLELQADDAVLRDIAMYADKDGRMALNILEQTAAMVSTGAVLTPELLEQVTGKRVHTYDKKGNAHYDTISAFIKSMRGSDPDAALHYMARMIEAGEQPSFIARRVVICAAEDVGLADPQALVLANAAAQAVQFVGWPEGRIPLAEAVVYIACAPKSNRAYAAIDKALADVRRGRYGTVPAHLKDAHYSGAAELGAGKGYQYPHAFESGWVDQQYLPDELVGTVYYEPSGHGRETEMAEQWKKRRSKT